MTAEQHHQYALSLEDNESCFGFDSPLITLETSSSPYARDMLHLQPSKSSSPAPKLNQSETALLDNLKGMCGHVGTVGGGNRMPSDVHHSIANFRMKFLCDTFFSSFFLSFLSLSLLSLSLPFFLSLYFLSHFFIISLLSSFSLSLFRFFSLLNFLHYLSIERLRGIDDQMAVLETERDQVLANIKVGR